MNGYAAWNTGVFFFHSEPGQCIYITIMNIQPTVSHYVWNEKLWFWGKNSTRVERVDNVGEKWPTTTGLYRWREREFHCVSMLPRLSHIISRYKTTHRNNSVKYSNDMQSQKNSLCTRAEDILMLTIKTEATPNRVCALTLWRPLLPYGYSYKSSCARPG